MLGSYRFCLAAFAAVEFHRWKIKGQGSKVNIKVKGKGVPPVGVVVY